MPTSTNLGLVTPASTDFVMNGATNMTTLANGVDAFYGAMTTYTPVILNVTSGTADARYRKIGKMFHLMVDGTGGTVTSAGTVTVSLPTGIVNIAVRTPVCAEVAGVGVVHAYIASSGNAVIIYGTAASGNFSAGANFGNVSFNVLFSCTI